MLDGQIMTFFTRLEKPAEHSQEVVNLSGKALLPFFLRNNCTTFRGLFKSLRCKTCQVPFSPLFCILNIIVCLPLVFVHYHTLWYLVDYHIVYIVYTIVHYCTLSYTIVNYCILLYTIVHYCKVL